MISWLFSIQAYIKPVFPESFLYYRIFGNTYVSVSAISILFILQACIKAVFPKKPL